MESGLHPQRVERELGSSIYVVGAGFGGIEDAKLTGSGVQPKPGNMRQGQSSRTEIPRGYCVLWEADKVKPQLQWRPRISEKPGWDIQARRAVGKEDWDPDDYIMSQK